MKAFLTKIAIVIMLCTSAQAAQAVADHAQWQVPARINYTYRFISSLILTTYFAVMDANKQSADFKNWQIDATTGLNIGWRTILFTYLNSRDAQVRDEAQNHAPEWAAEQNRLLALARTTSSMVTYNTRWDETIVKRYGEFRKTLETLVDQSYASTLAGASLVMTNLIWFYSIPMLWSPQFNTFYNRHTPNPLALAQGVRAFTGFNTLAIGTYMVADTISQHVLISLKHSIANALPIPADLRFFKFSDCTSCYFGTNLFGKNGPLAQFMKTDARDAKEDL